jgi:hypothetical protein
MLRKVLRDGLATAERETIRASRQTVTVTRLWIMDAGADDQ